jgi:hypothetical protein
VEPCEQKDNIAKIQAKLDARDEVLAEMRVKQVEIQGQIGLVGADIAHVKGRIDNGMSHTIANLNTLLTKLEPVIDHHSSIVKRIEGIGWTLATGLILTLVAYLGWGIAHGFKP